jgi:hypothetical protein
MAKFAAFLVTVLPYVRAIMLALSALGGGAVAQTVSQGGVSAVDPSTGLMAIIGPLIGAGLSQGALTWARSAVTKLTGSDTLGSIAEIDTLVAMASWAKADTELLASIRQRAHKWVDTVFGADNPAPTPAPTAAASRPTLPAFQGRLP